MRYSSFIAIAQGFELVKEIYLDPTPWTPDTLLTPTFKLKRNDAKLKYAAQVRRCG